MKEIFQNNIFTNYYKIIIIYLNIVYLLLINDC